MISLMSLTLWGFRSFKEKQTIKFPEAGAILVSGRYSDGSGGSSGSGKTSILKAITFAIGIENTPSTKLKNWYSKSFGVILTLGDGETVCEITRDPKLSIKINDVQQTGSSEELEQILAKFIQTPLDLVRSLTYREQRKVGKFINSTDSVKKQFLSELLGLTELEEAHDAIALESATYDQKLQTMVGELELLKSNLANLTPPAGAELQVEDEISVVNENKRIADIEMNEAERQRSELADIEKAADIAYKAAAPDTTAGQALYTAKTAEAKAFQLAIQNFNADIRRASSASSTNKGLRTQIMGLQTEIEKLSQCVCPTCEREWDKSQVLVEKKGKEIDNLLEEMQRNIEIVRAGEGLMEKIAEVQTQYDAVMKEANAARALPEDQVREFESMKAAYQSAAAATRSAITACESCKRTLFALNSQHQTLIGKKKMIEAAKTRVQLSAEEIVRREAEKDNLLPVIEDYGHALALLSRDGFMGVIFDEILGEIETRTNKMMESLPNVANFTFSVSSTKTTQKGAIKKSICTKLLCGGTEVDLDVVSGGQMGVVELCADLAVSETIRARFGSKLGFVILDEALENLGGYEKGLALEAIKANIRGQVLIVDHASEIKEGFASVIEIEFDGKNSKII